MISAEAAELLRGQVAAGDLDGHGREALLALRRDVRLAEALELASGRRSGSPAAAGAAGAFASSSSANSSRSIEKSRSSTQSPSSSSVDHLAEGVDADLVDQHLDPGPGAVDPQPLLAVEDPQAGLGDLEVVAVVELDELVQGGGDPGHDRGATADDDLDPADAVALASG